MSHQTASSTAWTGIRLPDAWPSEGARQLYLAMRRDPATNSAYHAAQRLRALKSAEARGRPTTPNTRMLTHWLCGRDGARLTPSIDSMVLIERLYPSVPVQLWGLPPTATVAETLAHFEDAA